MLLPIDQSDDSLLNFVRHIGSQSTYVSIEMYDLRQNIQLSYNCSKNFN